jgi:hypothetical protein
MFLGIETPIPPIPPIEANMQRIAGGGVTFGVEFRVLNEEMLNEHIASTNSDDAERSAAVADTSGVSIHVFGGDGHEYLRFDCFEDDPHYHYIRPGAEKQRVIGLDLAAIGPPLPWALACLRSRLQPMLCEAGGERIAAALDLPGVAAALDQVQETAHSLTRPA